MVTKMTKEAIISKDEFFENIFICALGNFSTIEGYMGINGIMSQVFGIDDYEALGSSYELPTFKTKQDEDTAKNNFMSSSIWYPFDCVYDYAINGHGHNCCIDEITDSIDFAYILHSDHIQISPYSFEIITMALVRHALEHDPTVRYINTENFNSPKAIAQLAGIDLRTLKNAISAGEIETLSKKELCASSLKKWLLTRKGFKPTFYNTKSDYFFNSPVSFAELLKKSREKIGDRFDPSDLLKACPNQPNVLDEIERGILDLPLDVLPLVSKIYEIPYPVLLKQVMQTYYPNEYSLLTN
jgi:hypothetical protein